MYRRIKLGTVSGCAFVTADGWMFRPYLIIIKKKICELDNKLKDSILGIETSNGVPTPLVFLPRKKQPRMKPQPAPTPNQKFEKNFFRSMFGQ